MMQRRTLKIKSVYVDYMYITFQMFNASWTVILQITVWPPHSEYGIYLNLLATQLQWRSAVELLILVFAFF